MGDVRLGSIYKLLHEVLGREGEGLPTDAQLLERFAASRDETAFEVLVHRHSRTVWNACRRILRREQDIEDAFQATFLILTRKAGAIAWRESVAGWLRRVARRVALKAKSKATKQAGLEQQRAVAEAIEDPTPECVWQEVRSVLDEEIERLPRKYRLPFVRCHLEGKTNAEVSQELGCPESTIASQLTRARQRLARQLIRRGVTLPAGLGAVVVLDKAGATAAVPAQSISATVQASLAYATGGVRAGIVSAEAVTLAEGVVHTMLMTKIGVGVGIVLSLGLLLGGTGLVVSQKSEPPPEEAAKTEGTPDTAAASAGEKKAEARQAARVDRYGDPLPEGAVARLGTIRLRHDGDLRSLCFMPDSKAIIAATDDGLRMWQFPEGKPFRTQRDLSVHPVIVSADGKRMAIGTWDGKVELWNPIANKRIRRMEGCHVIKDPRNKKNPRNKKKDILRPEQICAMAFLPGDRILASGAWGDISQSVRLWDMATGKELLKIESSLVGNERIYRGIAIAPNRWIAAIGSLNGVVRLLDLKSGKPVSDLKATEAESVQRRVELAFSEDEQKLATAGTEDGWITIWDVSTGKKLLRLKGEGGVKYKGYELWSLQWSPDGKMLAAGWGWPGGKVRLWNAQTGESLHTLKTTASVVRCLAFSSDSKTLIAGGSNQTLQMWNVSTGKSLPTPEGHENSVEVVAYSPNGRNLVSSGGNDGVLLWDINTCKPCRRFEEATYTSVLTYSPNGKILASTRGGNDRAQVQLWDAVTGKQLHVLKTARTVDEGDEYFCSLSFSPDNKTLATGKWRASTVDLWEVATGRHLRALKVGDENWPGTYAGQSSMAFSADGCRLISIDSRKIALWDIVTGKQLHAWIIPPSLRLFWLNLVVFSSDSRTIASKWGTDKEEILRLWEVASGQERLKIPLDNGKISAVSFSPDDRLMAVGSDNGTIQLWDTITGRRLHRFSSGHGRVGSLAFNPDGRTLASGGSNSTILIWDIIPWAGRRNHVAAVSPDELRASWSTLADADAAKAYQALGKLVATSDQAVPLLAEGLIPAPAVDSQRMSRLLADLDNDNFQVRKRARDELEKMKESAEPFLQQALKGRPTLEVRRSVVELLAKIEKVNGVSVRLLQMLRGVEVLERIGTPAARRALRKVAKTPPNPDIGAEAKAALGRLEAHLVRPTVP